MTLLDAYALIAFIAGEKAGEEVRTLMRAEPTGISTVNLSETADVLSRTYGVAHARVRAAVETLAGSVLTIVAVQAAHAWRAAELRSAHYHRTGCPVSLADCILLATAAPEDRVATADRHVLEVARREGVEAIQLPAAHP